uniref:Ig-like domain-containing protein n=1 Tax=Anolis carolinensis TaxID=28377 RepID=A0A803TFC9_ANOCA
TAASKTLLVLLLLLSPCFSPNFRFKVKPASKQVWEGNRFTISCEYATQFSTYFWYKQLPGKAPSLLLYITSAKNETADHFTAEYLDKGKKSVLHLSSAQLEDSGTYFCAVRGTVMQEARCSQSKPQTLLCFSHYYIL